MTDTNAAFRVISDRQLSQGILEGSAFKLLILPRAQALSPEELRAIKQFVNRGGVVLADLRPGVSDEHCKPYGKGALDGVFGVVQNTKRPELKEAVVEVPFSADGKPEPLCEALTDAALSVDRGEALGKAGDTPVMITHQYGKGRALLLNFSLDPYVQFKESISAMRIPYIRTINAPRLLQFFRHLRSELGSENGIRYVPELADLREYRFSSGGIDYLGLAQELPESVWKFAEGTAKPLKTRKTTVHLTKEAHIYDVMGGTYHGVSDRNTALIKPGMPPWKKVESPIVAITGVCRPAWTYPWARLTLAPIETSFQTVWNGGIIPRMVQPMSPDTITSSFLYFSLRMAWLIARNVPR